MNKNKNIKKDIVKEPTNKEFIIGIIKKVNENISQLQSRLKEFVKVRDSYEKVLRGLKND